MSKIVNYNFENGSEKAAAKRIGCSLEFYMQQRDAGLRWCGYKCKSWLPKADFHQSQAAKCKKCLNAYKEKGRAAAKRRKLNGAA